MTSVIFDSESIPLWYHSTHPCLEKRCKAKKVVGDPMGATLPNNDHKKVCHRMNCCWVCMLQSNTTLACQKPPNRFGGKTAKPKRVYAYWAFGSRVLMVLLSPCNHEVNP